MAKTETKAGGRRGSRQKSDACGACPSFLRARPDDAVQLPDAGSETGALLPDRPGAGGGSKYEKDFPVLCKAVWAFI